LAAVTPRVNLASKELILYIASSADKRDAKSRRLKKITVFAVILIA